MKVTIQQGPILEYHPDNTIRSYGAVFSFEHGTHIWGSGIWLSPSEIYDATGVRRIDAVLLGILSQKAKEMAALRQQEWDTQDRTGFKEREIREEWKGREIALL